MTREEYEKNPKLCLECGKPILCNGNLVAEALKRKFCSQSCSAKYNNKRRVKKTYYCKKCGVELGQGFEKFKGKTLCDSCHPNKVDWSTVTYGETKSKRNYQVHSRIRELARKKYYEANPILKCTNCGYDKHVEVCHKKAINSFDDSVTIAKINDIDNLIGLCPNCHWEYDNGLLKL